MIRRPLWIQQRLRERRDRPMWMMRWRWAWQMNIRKNFKLHSNCRKADWQETVKTSNKLYFQQSPTLAALRNNWAETLRTVTLRNEISTLITQQVIRVEPILQPTPRRCAWKPLKGITVIYWPKTQIRAPRTRKINRNKIYFKVKMAAKYKRQSLFTSRNNCNRKEERTQSRLKWWSIRHAT